MAKRQDAFALLTKVSDLLSRASRARERDDFEAAQSFAQSAQDLLGTYNATLAVTDYERLGEATERLHQVEAELELVRAVLCSYGRTPEENATAFDAALRLTSNLPSYFAARVDTCRAAVLIYEGDPRTALEYLESAYQGFEGSINVTDERSLVKYHQARAQVKLGRRPEAKALLWEIMPNLAGQSGPWAHAPRHIIAATIRLAMLEWSVWSRRGRKEARLLLEALTSSPIGGYPTELHAVQFIRAWGWFGFPLHFLLPADRRWAEF